MSLAALKFLFQSEPDHPAFREEIAWDVTEEIHRNIDAMPEDDLLEKTYEIDDFSSDLVELLAGTPVEQFCEHIKEWQGAASQHKKKPWKHVVSKAFRWWT